MIRLHRIVVPVERSERSFQALRPAQVIADFVGADIVAASVVAKAGDRAPVEAEIRERVAELGVPVAQVVAPVNGYTIGDGLEAVAHGPGVLVVIATDGHSRGLALKGSVAEELVHAREGKPTLLVGPMVDVERFDLSGPMILCRDPERPTPATDRLAHQVAQQLVMRQIALSVEPPVRTGGSRRDGSSGEPRGQATADRSAASIGDDDGLVVVHGSAPASSIVEFASEVGASIIAVGTHRRDGLSRLVFGSVAIATVSEAPCPVLVVPEIG